jgi:type VI secretion system ImpM family protein
VSALGQVGLLGKAPARADFIRLNAPAGVVHHFHRWLEDGCSALQGPLRAFPPEPLRFCFTAQGEKTALCGVAAASVDQVGRQFPLCVFVQLDAAQAAPAFPALPSAMKEFFQAAQGLLAEAGALAAPAFAEKLAALPAPTAEQLSAAQASVAASMSALTVAGATKALGADPAGTLHHALRTFVSGCAREKGREPPKANAVLDCAVSEELPEPAWLELSRRTLQWKGSPPSSFALGNRLLLSLGPPPPSVVGFLANPAATGTKLWPLKAADPRAIAASLQALTAAQKAALDAPETTLEALFQILAA